MRTLFLTLVLVGLLPLAGCGRGTKQDVVKKTEKVKTKAELEKALGKPDEFSKLGPLELWTYKTSDGEVAFAITGETVQLQAASGSRKE